MDFECQFLKKRSNRGSGITGGALRTLVPRFEVYVSNLKTIVWYTSQYYLVTHLFTKMQLRSGRALRQKCPPFCECFCRLGGQILLHCNL